MKIKKIISYLPVLAWPLTFLLPKFARADVTDPLVFEPQVGLPGLLSATTTMSQNDTSYIGQLAKGFYDYGLAIGGILAAIMLMAAGVLWLTSAGSSEAVSKAKGLISGSIAGLVLLFGAWFMLNTINPALINLNVQQIRAIKKISSVCCEFREDGKSRALNTLSNFCEDKNGTAYTSDADGAYVAGQSKCIYTKVSCSIQVDCDGVAKKCFDSDIKLTERQKCGGDFVNLYDFKDGRCTSHSECKNIIASCIGVENGEDCKPVKASDWYFLWSNGTYVSGYCYNTMCYIGNGKEGESCGTKPGAGCYSQNCSSLGQAGETYYKDNSSGRDCGEELYCCYKE